jgi:lipoprotein-anchoring transpeptidase ErfK/SrfK
MVRVREFAFVAAVAMSAMAGAAAWQSSVPTRQAAAPVAVAPKVAMVSAAAPSIVRPVASVAKPATPETTASKSPVIVWRGAVAQAAPPPSEDPSDANDAKPILVDQPIVPDAVLDGQARDVADRVRDSVPRELLSYFDVVLYVSKSAEGPWAQHMFVFQRNSDGALAYEQNFPVSTGRERHEKYFTSTPTGIFELDPYRFEPMHYSHTWHGAPMAWAMFLDYVHNGRLVGIALHSAGEHVGDLGMRASGGCVRLPPEKADMLFHRFQSEDRGLVPVLYFDQERNSTSTIGEMVRDAEGRPVMKEGYKVLLLIQDYPGGPALVAVLS